jgi:hypothetical protein
VDWEKVLRGDFKRVRSSGEGVKNKILNRLGWKEVCAAVLALGDVVLRVVFSGSSNSWLGKLVRF